MHFFEFDQFRMELKMINVMKKRFVFFFVAVFCSLFVCAIEVEWTFPPNTISTLGQNASDPSIAIDKSGNALVLWIENDVVLSCEGTEHGGWNPSSAISGSGASNPHVSMDDQGNAIAIWLEKGVVFSRSKPIGKDWSGTATPLSQAGASYPQLAVNAGGQAVAVWLNKTVVEAASGTFKGGWNSSIAISGSACSFPQVSIDVSGDVVAVWQQTDSSITSIYSSSQLRGGSWSVPAPISLIGENCASPNISLSSSTGEKAIAIWYSYDLKGSTYSNVITQVASLQQDGTWATPVKFNYPGIIDPYSFPTKVVMDDSGNAIAMWITSTDGSLYTVVFSAKPRGGFWSYVKMLVLPNVSCFGFALCPLKNGDALGAWMVLDQDGKNLIIETSVASLQLVNYDPASSNEASEQTSSITSQMMWDPYITLSQGASNGYPQLASSYSNNYINMAACWLSYDGTYTSIQASLGGIDEPSPPTGLSVSQSTTNYGLVSDVCNTLSWNASTDKDVLSYRIYRNGNYVVSVPASQLNWVDHNQVDKQSVSYGVQTVIESLFVSEIAEITWP